ncbi:MAG TPA: glycosyltransferase [Verrucomicrobiae bacterium]|nr:glycosyltransferase [Verrucomicrobiae bacterium]
MAQGSELKRVLILSASAGTGHVRAAEALEKVCRMTGGVGETIHFDALSFTNKLFRDFYSKFYIRLVRDAPTLLGWWYEKSDEPWLTDRMRLMFDRMNTQPLVRMIGRLNPDITICTHFLPAEIISWLMMQGRVSTKLSIVVTDMDFHAMWLSRSFHRYFVAIDETREHLRMMGLPASRVTVSGIPIDPAFSEPFDAGAFRSANGLGADRPLVLVSAGALGVGPAEHMARILTLLRTPSQVVIICGRREGLTERVEQRLRESGVKPHLRFKTVGYTNQMHGWMRVADVFVGKPGGLTAAESLACGLPFVVFSPIPGQEERNSDHLLEKGVAIRCNELTTMPYKLDALLGDPARLASMRLSAVKLARPHAARTVVRTLLRGDADDSPVTVEEKEQEEMARIARKR